MQLTNLYAGGKRWAGAGLVVTAGLIVGWWATALPKETAKQVAPDSWSLPEGAALSRFDANDFRTIMKSKAWASASATANAGAGGPGARTKSTPPEWSLVGTVTTPNPVALIIVKGAQDVMRLGPGQLVPGAGRIKEIESTGIQLDAGGCSVRIKLFQAAEARPSKCSQQDKQTTASQEAGDH